jgi:hypothetical protein
MVLFVSVTIFQNADTAYRCLTNLFNFAETADFQSKEEARQRYIAKLQEQYEKDAAVKAEKAKQVG